MMSWLQDANPAGDYFLIVDADMTFHRYMLLLGFCGNSSSYFHAVILGHVSLPGRFMHVAKGTAVVVKGVAEPIYKSQPLQCMLFLHLISTITKVSEASSTR